MFRHANVMWAPVNVACHVFGLRVEGMAAIYVRRTANVVAKKFRTADKWW